MRIGLISDTHCPERCSAYPVALGQVFRDLDLTAGQLSTRIVMATLHLLCGFIGAGKTTFAKSLERDHSAVLFSHDEWMVRLYGRNPPSEHFQTYYHRVEDLIWQMASRFLALGHDVVLDHGFWSRADRDLARRKSQEIGVPAKLYFLHYSEEVMRERVLIRTEESQESLYSLHAG